MRNWHFSGSRYTKIIPRTAEIEFRAVRDVRETSPTSSNRNEFPIREADQKKLVPMLHYNGMPINAGFIVDKVREEIAKGR